VRNRLSRWICRSRRRGLEDLFVDAAAGKALIRWVCALEKNGKKRAWRGLDILHVRDGRITEKHTYAKADVPRREPDA